MTDEEQLEAMDLLLECSRVFLDYSIIHREKHGKGSEQYLRNHGMFEKCHSFLDRMLFEKLENFPENKG